MPALRRRYTFKATPMSCGAQHCTMHLAPAPERARAPGLRRQQPVPACGAAWPPPAAAPRGGQVMAAVPHTRVVGGGGVAAAPPMSFVVQRRGAQAPGRHLRTCSRITRPQSTDPVLTLRGNLMHARWSRGVFRQSESELQLFPNDGAHVATNRPAHWTPTKLFTRPQFCFGMSCSLHSTVEGDCAVH